MVTASSSSSYELGKSSVRVIRWSSEPARRRVGRFSDGPPALYDSVHASARIRSFGASGSGWGLPIYLCQRGLTEEGLIETKADWYVQHIDLIADAIAATAVSELLRAWPA